METILFRAIKGGFTRNPREEIKEWVKENYDLENPDDYGYVMDYIAYLM